jgi:hypothetical protein
VTFFCVVIAVGQTLFGAPLLVLFGINHRAGDDRIAGVAACQCRLSVVNLRQLMRDALT